MGRNFTLEKNTVINKYNVLTLLIVLFACVSCNEEQFGIDKFGSIPGVVVDGETYEPMPGVLISTAPASTTILTDSTGSFSFDKVREGEINVTARRKDLLTQSVNVVVFPSENNTSTFFMLNDERNIGNVMMFDPVLGNGAVNQPLSQTFTWNLE